MQTVTIKDDAEEKVRMLKSEKVVICLLDDVGQGDASLKLVSGGQVKNKDQLYIIQGLTMKIVQEIVRKGKYDHLAELKLVLHELIDKAFEDTIHE